MLRKSTLLYFRLRTLSHQKSLPWLRCTCITRAWTFVFVTVTAWRGDQKMSGLNSFLSVFVLCSGYLAASPETIWSHFVRSDSKKSFVLWAVKDLSYCLFRCEIICHCLRNVTRACYKGVVLNLLFSTKTKTVPISKHYTKRRIRDVELKLHAFLTSEIDKSEGRGASSSRCVRFALGKV
jgi:hypothetical protein